MRTLLQDLRYGARTARRQPGFSFVVVLTLVGCVALLVGTMVVFVRFFGAFMAYLPVVMPVDGVGRFEEARRQLARDSTEYTRWVGLADVALWSVDAGFDPQQARSGDRVGLTGMSERAAEIGWIFWVESCPGQGTRIRVEKPSKGT